MIFSRSILALLAASLVSGSIGRAQDAAPPASAGSKAESPAETVAQAAPVAVIPDKRAYGVLPNYRTAEADQPYARLTTGQKFTIARKDTLDWPSYFLAGFFAGVSQFNNSNPSFGQGLEGYGKRYGSSVIDQDVGNFLTEAILPTLFHQDPRYFRKGHGTVLGRIAYAASRSVITKNDSGKAAFNYSEFLGNGMVGSLGNAYYKDSVGFSPTMQRMFSQIGTDTLSQVLKEFWPDVKRKLSHHKDSTD